MRLPVAIVSIAMVVAVAGCSSSSPGPSASPAVAPSSAASSGGTLSQSASQSGAPSQATLAGSGANGSGAPSSAPGSSAPGDSFAPIGSDNPDGSPVPSDTATHFAPDLEALLPGMINETALVKASATGDSVFEPDDPTGAMWISFLASHGKKPSDFRFAQAEDPTDTIDLFVAVFQVSGLDSATVQGALIAAGRANTPEVTESTVSLAGKSVTKIAYPDSPSSSYIYQHATDVFDIETGDAAIATQMMLLLP
jgi:hypothetical protein